MATQDLTQKLLNLQQELENKKIERSEYQGELRSLMQQLKTFGLSSLNDAEKFVKKEKEELKKEEERIRNEIEEIKELMYGEVEQDD